MPLFIAAAMPRLMITPLVTLRHTLRRRCRLLLLCYAVYLRYALRLRHTPRRRFSRARLRYAACLRASRYADTLLMAFITPALTLPIRCFSLLLLMMPITLR